MNYVITPSRMSPSARARRKAQSLNISLVVISILLGSLLLAIQLYGLGNLLHYGADGVDKIVEILR